MPGMERGNDRNSGVPTGVLFETGPQMPTDHHPYVPTLAPLQRFPPWHMNSMNGEEDVDYVASRAFETDLLHGAGIFAEPELLLREQSLCRKGVSAPLPSFPQDLSPLGKQASITWSPAAPLSRHRFLVSSPMTSSSGRRLIGIPSPDSSFLPFAGGAPALRLPHNDSAARATQPHHRSPIDVPRQIQAHPVTPSPMRPIPQFCSPCVQQPHPFVAMVRREHPSDIRTTSRTPVGSPPPKPPSCSNGASPSVRHEPHRFILDRRAGDAADHTSPPTPRVLGDFLLHTPSNNKLQRRTFSTSPDPSPLSSPLPFSHLGSSTAPSPTESTWSSSSLGSSTSPSSLAAATAAAASAISSQKSGGASPAPLPQNLRGDPHRQAKIKTELCLYYLRGVSCPFKEKCNYAHGEDELKYSKLVELERNGLVPSALAYRTHPCLSWVSTGACPFGQRCSSLHDPRVEGSKESWLPHTEVPVNNVPTMVSVDRFYHRNAAALWQDNPLISPFVWKNCRPSMQERHRPRRRYRRFGTDENHHVEERWRCLLPSFPAKPEDVSPEVQDTKEWRDTYMLVTNMTVASSLTSTESRSLPSPSTDNSMPKINETQRLAIAILVCKSSLETATETQSSRPVTPWDFVYDPQHLVYNELCMVLQTRYFTLLRPRGGKSSVGATNSTYPHPGMYVKEISQQEYKATKTPWDNRFPYNPRDVVVVRLLAFGPLGEGSNTVSLWFDVADTDVVRCTSQDVKKHKRIRFRTVKPDPQAKEPIVQGIQLLLPSFRVVDTTSEGQSPPSQRTRTASFLSPPHPPFFLMQPAENDPKTGNLLVDIMQHRLKDLYLSMTSGSQHRAQHIRQLTQEENCLRQKYMTLQKVCRTWKWPPTVGREAVTEDIPIPRCDAQYQIPIPSPGSSRQRHTNSTRKHRNNGFPAADLWESFVSNMEVATKNDTTPLTTEVSPQMHDDDGHREERPRLRVFRDLSMGMSIDTSNPGLPRLAQSAGTLTPEKQRYNNPTAPPFRRWNGVLDTDQDGNVWTFLKVHYTRRKPSLMNGQQLRAAKEAPLKKKMMEPRPFPSSTKPVPFPHQ